jgi:Flp pilus assembly protein TadG
MTGRTALRWRTRRDRDSGVAPLELLLLAPVIIALLALTVGAGRITIVQGSVDAAARDAARQASISRSPEAARTAALASADATLNQEGLRCSINTDDFEAAFGVPVGEPSTVTVTVQCTVNLSDLAVPGLPGSVPLSSKFSSPLDPYRGRTLGLGPARPVANLASGGN